MNDARKLWLLLGALSLGLLLYLLAPVLTPFLAAAALAYIGDPLVDRLQARGLSRSIAVTTVFLGLTVVALAVLVVLLPMLQRQLALLVAKLPGYLGWLQEQVIPWLSHRLGFEVPSFDPAALQGYLRSYWQSAGGFMAGLFGLLSRSGLTVLGWLVNLFLIPVVTFYLLRDWDVLVQRLGELVPRRYSADVVRLARASDDALAAFMRGQLMVMLALGTVYSIGLWLVGLEFALLIGMLAGLVSFVPYMGFIVGIAIAGVAAVVQFQELLPLVFVIGVFGIGQILEGMVFTPLLLGERIGLHPVIVIFAVLAGGQLFGFFGVLLALPVASVAVVLLRFTHERYVASNLYTRRSSE